MAFNINLLPLFARIEPRGGRMLCLGRQRVLFDGAALSAALGVSVADEELSQEAVFECLGYGSIESLDVSDYEGAEHIFDLNDPVAPEGLIGAFDAVFTGGTLEHVFHTSTALKHAASFVRPGGALVHIGPANGWINHGFYQLCPGLLLDYLATNDWRVEASVLIHVLGKSEGTSHWKLTRALQRNPRPEGIRQLHWCVARRTPAATIDRVPVQSIYAKKHGGGETGAVVPDFEMAEVVNGIEISRGA